MYLCVSVVFIPTENLFEAKVFYICVYNCVVHTYILGHTHITLYQYVVCGHDKRLSEQRLVTARW